MRHRSGLWALIAAALVVACNGRFSDGISLSKGRVSERSLRLGERVPDGGEAAAIGPIANPILRGTAEFGRLVRCDGAELVFKDEEGTGADRMMTARLRARLRQLSTLVAREWPELRLRVTEAWDERREHGPSSAHYEGRAADITTSDMDPRKLGRLGRLAVDAGLDWVLYEDASHVHVSVQR